LNNTNTAKKSLQKDKQFLLYKWDRPVTLVKTPVICYESGKKDGNVTRENGTYPQSCVAHIFQNGYRIIIVTASFVMTST